MKVVDFMLFGEVCRLAQWVERDATFGVLLITRLSAFSDQPLAATTYLDNRRSKDLYGYTAFYDFLRPSKKHRPPLFVLKLVILRAVRNWVQSCSS